MQNTVFDELELEYGTAILSELIGQPLTRNQQPVRLFDQSRHSAECYFRADARTGKPYVQDFQNSKRYYPVTAYCQAYRVDLSTALASLSQQYLIPIGPNKPRTPPQRVTKPAPLPLRVDFLSAAQYQKCQIKFERNGLHAYLAYRYSPASADEVFMRYRLGTSRRWRFAGHLATCLPQFDSSGNLRQVKIIPFDAITGRRLKEKQTAEQWNFVSQRYEPTKPNSDKVYFAGKQLAKESGLIDPHLQQCYFGEHLLGVYPDAEVALVEGETTAIECAIVYPQFIWLATGGSNGGRWDSPERFSVLRGRHVVLWPDIDKHEEWQKKAGPLRPLVASLKVSNYVRNNAPTGKSKFDLRDLLKRPYWIINGKTVYGEVLDVEPCDTYPAEWDTPNPPDAVPTIQLKHINSLSL